MSDGPQPERWDLLIECLQDCGIQVTWDMEGFPGVDVSGFHDFFGRRPLAWSDRPKSDRNEVEVG